ncbi:MAG: hypothetical protein JXB49_16275 [Bacteroidales bacterium]|nr:hypothetical protein [Bacteroidales bacterium]
MNNISGRRRCIWCSKWLPLDHDSGFCSTECEKSYNKEGEYWERYKEKNLQKRIQNRKEKRNEHNICLNCGNPILQNDKGRYRKYCGDDCKQEAYRKRKKQD